MTGSLSVRGEVLPVGGVTSKVEAAINAGIKSVILPASNLDDVSLAKDKLKGIRLIPAKTLADVLKSSLKDCKRKDEIISELKDYERGPRQARNENAQEAKPKSAPKTANPKRPERPRKR
jgi:Lon-like ATP-dependent protease